MPVEATTWLNITPEYTNGPVLAAPSGQVLIVGGEDRSGRALDTAELYQIGLAARGSI